MDNFRVTAALVLRAEGMAWRYKVEPVIESEWLSSSWLTEVGALEVMDVLAPQLCGTTHFGRLLRAARDLFGESVRANEVGE